MKSATDTGPARRTHTRIRAPGGKCASVWHRTGRDETVSGLNQQEICAFEHDSDDRHGVGGVVTTLVCEQAQQRRHI